MLGTVLIVIGAMCILGAAGNDDYYTAMHEVYPLKDILLWMISGFAFIGLGVLLKTIKLKG